MLRTADALGASPSLAASKGSDRIFGSRSRQAAASLVTGTRASAASAGGRGDAGARMAAEST